MLKDAVSTSFGAQYKVIRAVVAKAARRKPSSRPWIEDLQQEAALAIWSKYGATDNVPASHIGAKAWTAVSNAIRDWRLTVRTRPLVGLDVAALPLSEEPPELKGPVSVCGICGVAFHHPRRGGRRVTCKKPKCQEIYNKNRCAARRLKIKEAA